MQWCANVTNKAYVAVVWAPPPAVPWTFPISSDQPPFLLFGSAYILSRLLHPYLPIWGCVLESLIWRVEACLVWRNSHPLGDLNSTWACVGVTHAVTRLPIGSRCSHSLVLKLSRLPMGPRCGAVTHLACWSPSGSTARAGRTSCSSTCSRWSRRWSCCSRGRRQPKPGTWPHPGLPCRSEGERGARSRQCIAVPAEMAGGRVL